MATRSALGVLVRDEFVGFAKSKVMLVLWILMPVIAIAGYLLLPAELKFKFVGPFQVSATMYMSVLTSTLAGTIAAVMVAVDIVSERNRKVYELFVIRPIRRDAIIWSKFLAVYACIAMACIIAITVGIAIDIARGASPSGEMFYDLARSLATLAGVLAVSTSGGVFIGVLSRTSIVAAVVLVLQVGQNLTLVPLLPGFLGVLPDRFWIVMVLSLFLATGLVHAAALLFRRAEF